MNNYPTSRDLNNIFYTSIKDPQIEVDQKNIKQQVDNFVAKRKLNTEFQTDAHKLKEALDEYEQIWAGNISKADAHLWFASAKDMEDTEIKAKSNKITDRKKTLIAQLQFFELNIAKITKDNQKTFINSTELEGYKHYLKKIFETAKYNVSEKEENILLKIRKTSYESWTDMIELFFSKEEVTTQTDNGKETKNFNELFALLENPKQEIRDEAAQHINTIMSKHIDTCEQEINSVLEYKKQIDQIRKYPQVDTARHLTDDINTETVHTLIKTVQSKFSTAQRLYQLKAKILQKDKLAYHERNLPVGKTNKKYSYEKAINIVMNAFKNLDQEFADIFERFLQQGRIDTFPQKGKMGGAFNYPFCHKYPSLIMLNYTETISDIKTLAHEVGHGIHSELSQENQNSLQYRYGMAVAEVASTFMEDFALQEAIKDASEEEKLIIMIDKINADISTIHRQTACYLFELDLHKNYREKGFLSKNEIGTLFKKNMEAYMGDYVTQDQGSENRRTYRSHIRMFFYVYSYSGGLLISKALQAKVKQDPSFIKIMKKEFLSAGSSKSPKEIFTNMGIDINDKSFWESGLQEIEDNLTKAEQLAKKLGKI